MICCLMPTIWWVAFELHNQENVKGDQTEEEKQKTKQG